MESLSGHRVLLSWHVMSEGLEFDASQWGSRSSSAANQTYVLVKGRFVLGDNATPEVKTLLFLCTICCIKTQENRSLKNITIYRKGSQWLVVSTFKTIVNRMGERKSPNLRSYSETVAVNTEAWVLDFTRCAQTKRPGFVLLQLEMAVACHQKALSKVVIRGSAQDVPIGWKYHVATSERTKSRKLEKIGSCLLRDREPCAGCHRYALAGDKSWQQLPSTRESTEGRGT